MKKRIVTLALIAAIALIPPSPQKAKAQVPPAVAICGIVIVGVMGYMAIRAVIKIMNRAETNRAYAETNGLVMTLTPEQLTDAVYHPIRFQSTTNMSPVDQVWIDEQLINVWQYTNSVGSLMAVATTLTKGGTEFVAITNQVGSDGWVTFDFSGRIHPSSLLVEEQTPSRFYRMVKY